MRVRAGLSSEPESVDTRMSGRFVPSPKCCRGTGLSPWCAPAFDHRSSTHDHIRIRVTATANSVASIDPPALIRKRGQSLLPSLSQVDITAGIRQIPLLEMLERIRPGMVACSFTRLPPDDNFARAPTGSPTTLRPPTEGSLTGNQPHLLASMAFLSLPIRRSATFRSPPR
jgi:hypothetical protein